MKPFYAEIYDNTGEFQSVYVYPTTDETNVVDCHIIMPVFIEPSDIRYDVEAWLRSQNDELILGNLRFQRAENTMIHP